MEHDSKETIGERDKIGIKLSKMFGATVAPTDVYETGAKGFLKVDLSKNEEIAILEWLVNQDSYFNISLDSQDVQIMIQNIRNDFGLFDTMNGTMSIFSSYLTECETAQRELTEEKEMNDRADEAIAELKKHMAELESSVVALQEIETEHVDTIRELETDLRELKDELMRRLIRVKLDHAEELTPDERDWLKGNL